MEGTGGRWAVNGEQALEKLKTLGKARVRALGAPLCARAVEKSYARLTIFLY